MGMAVWNDGHSMPVWDAANVTAFLDDVEIDIYGYDGEPFQAAKNQDRNTVTTNAKGQSIVVHNENDSGNITINVSRVSRVYSQFLNDKNKFESEHKLVLITPSETVVSDSAVLSKESDISSSISSAPTAQWVFHCGSYKTTGNNIYNN